MLQKTLKATRFHECYSLNSEADELYTQIYPLYSYYKDGNNFKFSLHSDYAMDSRALHSFFDYGGSKVDGQLR